MNFRIQDFSEIWMDLKVHKLRDRGKVFTKSLKICDANNISANTLHNVAEIVEIIVKKPP
jgi:hypothetical protein